MMKKLNRASAKAYLGVRGFFQELKNDEWGLSGVVVAVLLILIAVLAVAGIWSLLGKQLTTWWNAISSQSFDPMST